MADFDDKGTQASACNFSFQLPPFTIGFTLPAIPALPALPSLPFNLALSCDPAKPANVVGDAPYGGGRQPNLPPVQEDT